ncbi:MAG: response regulator [Firmicutes bacterium]|nr:response regulator [Bacillota bacterium]
MSRLAGNVLVVDDLETNREALMRMLEREGLSTEGAQDGIEALEKVRVRPFDAILLDVMMPRLDGLQTLAILKKEFRLRDIPVIMLSALNESKTIRECIEMGADDYLPKPIDRSLLKARLSACLHRKKTLDSERNYLARLESTNDELRRLNLLKSRFLGIAAHDLKNPMTTILVLAQQLEESLDQPAPIETRRKQLNRIQEAVKKMLSIIQAQLDSAASESGQVDLCLAPTDLAQMAKEVIEDNHLYAASKQIVLHCVAPESPITAYLDDTRIRDVMDNLVNNAIKFSPPARTIRLEVERVDRLVHFSVHDQGPGLTDEDKKLVFGLYQRLSATPTGSELSTGLGLSIVKQRVELHGGRVWVESEAGHGATFHVELPQDARVKA